MMLQDINYFVFTLSRLPIEANRGLYPVMKPATTY